MWSLIEWILRLFESLRPNIFYVEGASGEFSYPNDRFLRSVQGRLNHPAVVVDLGDEDPRGVVTLQVPEDSIQMSEVPEFGNDNESGPWDPDAARDDTSLFRKAIFELIERAREGPVNVTLVIPRNFVQRPLPPNPFDPGYSLPDTMQTERYPADYVIRHPYRNGMTELEYEELREELEISEGQKPPHHSRAILEFNGDNFTYTDESGNEVRVPIRVRGENWYDPPVIRVSGGDYFELQISDGDNLIRGWALGFENCAGLEVKDIAIDGNRAIRGLDPAVSGNAPWSANGGGSDNIRITSCNYYALRNVVSVNSVASGISINVSVPMTNEKLWQNARLDNCRVLNSAYLGLNIRAGRRIRIKGGEYSFTNALSTMAGIAMESLGYCTRVFWIPPENAPDMPIIADILIEGVTMRGNWKDVHLNGRWNNGWVSVKGCTFIRTPSDVFPHFNCDSYGDQDPCSENAAVAWPYAVGTNAMWVSVREGNTFSGYYNPNQRSPNSSVILVNRYNLQHRTDVPLPPGQLMRTPIDTRGGHVWIGNNRFYNDVPNQPAQAGIWVRDKSGEDITVRDNRVFKGELTGGRPYFLNQNSWASMTRNYSWPLNFSFIQLNDVSGSSPEPVENDPEPACDEFRE